ncbi:MAG: hypothetical protein MI741_13145, partial [Rhodospirillales bacterium]|nr:hypothetical protein [Rhodospirillales bacterium]
SCEGIWADWTNVSEYRLKPLSYDESLELVSALLGKDRNLDDLKGSIVKRAQGNPFFLTECSRSIRDADGDSGTRSTHMARFGTPAQIPASIHGLLAERIDRLSPKQKAIVQGAAIVGQKFDIDLLKMIVGSSARSLVVDLGSLEKAGFVERTRIIPRLEFSFRHALIYDVAYGSVLRKRRTEMHGRLLRQIEKRSRQAFPNKPELLAYHACRSRNLPETYLYCRKAGQRAQEKSRNREAAGYFENSLAALGKLPKTARNAARSFDTGLDFVQTLFPLSNYAAAWKNLSVCRELSHTLEDRRRAAKLSSAETLYHWITGDVEQSVRSGWEAHQLSVKLKDQELQIVGAGRLGAILLERGDYLDARRLLTETISRIPPEENHKRFGLLVSAPVSCRASLSRCLGELGLFEEALAEGDDAIRIADELDHRFSQLYANLFVGNVLMRRGEFDRSMPLLERAFEICQSTRSDLLYPFVAGSIGYAHSKTGKLLKGKAMIAEAVEAACRQEVRTRLPLMMMWLAETQFESGDAGQAKFSASKATSVAQEIGEKGHQAWSLWMRGDLLSRSGDGESYEVSGYLRQAVSIAQRRQMKPLLAMCQYTQNRLAQRTGAWVNFGAGTGRSDAELRALGMRHWLDSRTPVYEPATREYQFLPVENQHRDR